MTSFGGINIQEHFLVSPKPVLQLKPDVPCGGEFRSEMNRWLLEQFGSKEVAYMFGDTLLVSAGYLSQLKAELAADARYLP